MSSEHDLFMYERFGSPDTGKKIIDAYLEGVRDPNAQYEHYLGLLSEGAADLTRTMVEWAIAVQQFGSEEPSFIDCFFGRDQFSFPMAVIENVHFNRDWVNPELYKVLYPLPENMQTVADDIINDWNFLWTYDRRSTCRAIGNFLTRPLPKSKTKLRKGERKQKPKEKHGSENPGIPRVSLSPSILANLR